MQENVTFVRDDVLPSYWANRLQQLLSTYSDFILSQASPTSVQIVAGVDDQAAICTVAGKWRFIEATVSRAHPGGAAGVYDIFAVTAANDVDNVPDPFSDHTNYAFSLRIVAHGTTPPIVAGSVDHFRKIGECAWDGAQITKVTQLVGVAPPDALLVVGDMKASLQANDHPGWVLMDGRANLARADYPPDFVALMDGLGLVGVDAPHFAVPDWRGRTIVARGTHASVDVILENDGRPVADRRPWHRHQHVSPIAQRLGLRSIVSPLNDPAYFTYDPGGVDNAASASGNIGNQGADAGEVGSAGTSIETRHLITSTGDGPAYGVANIFVFTGEGTATGGGGGGGGSVGVGPPNVQAASYTLQETDAQHVVEMNAAGATVVTVPTDVDQPMPIGTIIEVARMGAGAVTIAAEGGVTLRSQGGLLSIGHQYGAVSLRKRAADEWVLVGDLA